MKVCNCSQSPKHLLHAMENPCHYTTVRNALFIAPPRGGNTLDQNRVRDKILKLDTDRQYSVRAVHQLCDSSFADCMHPRVDFCNNPCGIGGFLLMANVAFYPLHNNETRHVTKLEINVVTGKITVWLDTILVASYTLSQTQEYAPPRYCLKVKDLNLPPTIGVDGEYVILYVFQSPLQAPRATPLVLEILTDWCPTTPEAMLLQESLFYPLVALRLEPCHLQGYPRIVETSGTTCNCNADHFAPCVKCNGERLRDVLVEDIKKGPIFAIFVHHPHCFRQLHDTLTRTFLEWEFIDHARPDANTL